MNWLSALAEIFSCGFLATWIARRWVAPTREGAAAFALAWFTLFAGFFFGVFFLLGFIDFATDWATVRVPLAAVVSGSIALIVIGTGRVADAPAGSVWSSLREEFRRVWTGLDRPSRVFFVSVAATFVFMAVMLCAEFPRGYEPKAYHLPIAAHIFQTHSFRVWDSEYMDTLPANASLYYGFLLSFLPEHLVSASNLLFLVPLLASFCALGRWAGSGTSAALIGACGASTIPIVAFSCLETGADVAGIACLGSAAFFALARNPLSVPDIVLAGIAAGLAFGFKSIHLVSIFFLFVVIVVRRWSAVRSSSASRQRAAAVGAGIFLAGVLGMSAVWLFRNEMKFRNPVYPVHVARISNVLGWPQAPDVDYVGRRAFELEWVHSPSEWFLYPWVEWHMHNENFKHSSGLGAFFAAMVPPALVVSLLAVGSRERTDRLPLTVLLTGCAVLFAVWWSLGDRQPRYLLGGLIYAIPLVAWMIMQSSARARTALAFIACASGIFMLGVVLTKFGYDVSYRVLRLQFSRHQYYGYPAAVDRLPAGSTVVNLVARPFNWACFGARHTNRVINSRKARRLLGTSTDEAPPQAVSLDRATLHGLDATYILALSTTRLQPGHGVALTEIGRSEGKTEEPPFLPVLYRVDYQDPAPVGASAPSRH